MHLFKYSFRCHISMQGLLWGGAGGGQEISGLEDRYISAFATLTGHGSRQTRRLVAEIVHGSRGNNPSFLCPYPSGFMGVRIISSWLSSFQILETIFLSEKQMGKALSSWSLTFRQDCLPSLGTLHWSFQLWCLT